ncbi:high affinity copper uptake protein 1-like [Musca domestica]|uniref:Copper transport protein n=1 Tax=Musca domestica TaxID=7370 RepID=A0ABM3VBH6_MUSDO|nr:high affinity copper uptake protein 1-like [Musca domestica]
MNHGNGNGMGNGMGHGNGNGNGGGMGGMHHGACPMNMAFHFGHKECILWEGWLPETVTEFVFSALALFAAAFLYEAIKFVREYLLRRTAEKDAAKRGNNTTRGTVCPKEDESASSSSRMPLLSEKTYLEKILAKPHLIQASINLIQIIMSYLLMLVFMTYNYWLCLSVVLGLALGYLFFGWIKQDAYDSECCQ